MILPNWTRAATVGGVAWILLTAACSSGSGSSSAGVACKNPPPYEVACDSCDHDMCPSQYSAIVSSCTALYSCQSSCQCSDSACTDACINNPADLTADCKSALQTLFTCQLSSCGSACQPQGSVSDGGFSE